MNQITREQYLKLLLHTGDCVSDVREQINHQLTDLHVTGKCEFTLEMVKKFVVYLFEGSPRQIAVLNFMLDHLIEVQQQPQRTLENYVPSFPHRGYPHWAADGNGKAWYYTAKPTVDKEDEMWRGPGFKADDNFDASTYAHMWVDGEWEKSYRKL